MSERFNYVAIKPCGCVGPICAASDSPHVTDTLDGWAASGYRVAEMPRAEAVDAHLRPCPHAKQEPSK